MQAQVSGIAGRHLGPDPVEGASKRWCTELDDGYTPCIQLNYDKKLIRHGNSAALVLDKALLDLLKVQMDTPLEVTTDGKNIIISPQMNEKAEATLLQALERINQKHGTVLSRLGK